MIARRMARWVAVLVATAGLLAGSAGAALAVDPCPGDRAADLAAQDRYQFLVDTHAPASQVSAALAAWQNAYNKGRHDHCW